MTGRLRVEGCGRLKVTIWAGPETQCADFAPAPRPRPRRPYPRPRPLPAPLPLGHVHSTSDILKARYASPPDRILLISMIGLVWDRAEPGGYMRMSAIPPASDPPPAVLTW